MQDDLDIKILQLLQKDGKLTYEQIGGMLDRSPSTIRDRIKKLEDDRVILGYAAIVDECRIGVGCDAYVSADIEPSKMAAAMGGLFSLKNVTEILHLTGERRLLLRIKVTSNKELTDILDKKIRPLGFHNIETSIILDPVLRYPGL